MNKRKEICDYLSEEKEKVGLRFDYIGSQNHHNLLEIKPSKKKRVYVEVDDEDDIVSIGVLGIPFNLDITYSSTFWVQEMDVSRNFYQNKTIDIIAKRFGLRRFTYDSILYGKNIPFFGLDISKNGTRNLQKKDKNLVDRVANVARIYHTIINSSDYTKKISKSVRETISFISSQVDSICMVTLKQNLYK